jgi:hypothetical protein
MRTHRQDMFYLARHAAKSIAWSLLDSLSRKVRFQYENRICRLHP